MANYCVQTAIHHDYTECEVGGPTTYNHREIGEIAFNILNRQARYRNIPVAILKVLIFIIKPFSAKQYALGTFLIDVMTMDAVAPSYGLELFNKIKGC